MQLSHTTRHTAVFQLSIGHFVQVPELPEIAPTTTSKGGQWAAAPSEIDRRRNFAIISHPDAGKTTLTEKLLLYGGAIQEVRARWTVRIRVLVLLPLSHDAVVTFCAIPLDWP